MVKILINLTKEEDKIVSIYKVIHELKTKEDAVKQIILSSSYKKNTR